MTRGHLYVAAISSLGCRCPSSIFLKQQPVAVCAAKGDGTRSTQLLAGKEA